MKLVDPIAQTFYVQPSSGYFVTSIDLYFYSKDPTLPVTVQLRPTVYGQPAESFYQYSEVILTPDKINLSNDGSAATRVKFESPIYLEGETFHCICLSTNSDQYRVHISRLTEMDLSSSTMSSVFVTQQPLSGSFFNSQNGETWTPVQTDDLKFTLYRANFKASQGDINFYNSELGLANAQIATLNQNPLEINSREIRVGLGSTLTAPSLALGNLVSQVDSTGTGTLINIAGIASGPLKVINSGIGYTPSSGVLTYTNVPLTTLSGSGTNATATITITNGSVTSVGASISNGGNGYKIGDVVTPTTIGASNLGANMRLSVQSIAGINELILDNVQGKFEVNNSNKTLYINSSGGQDLYFSGSVKAFPNNISVEKNGEIIKVNHQNHGMHSTSNKVKLSDISSDLGQTKLSTAVTNTSTTIVLASSENFNTFENLPVSATNPGYIQIGAEIISYTGVTGNTLTGITRSIDQTISSTYSVNDSVMKYELNGVSLRRINKTHTLSEGNNGLDYYNIKIDFSQAGNIATLPQGITNRGSDSTLGPLFFNRSESTGGNKVKATQNIPFEISRPLIDAKIHPGTNVISKIRTVSGTSISGNEVSYQDKGFSEFSLFENNYFNSPRLVASKVNEDSYLTTLPGKKSLTLNLQLNTTNSYISPTIDLQRVALSFTSNRINNLITNFELDSRVSSLNSDPSAFVYACLPIQIELPANALKIYITAHINNYSDIKCLYSISNNPDDPLVYYPFPGYNNIGSNNETLDLSKNSGLPDKNYIKENIVGFKPNEISYREYVFTVNNLSPFRYYSIKLVGTSTNQAYPPRVKDLRVIALAGDV
jgi:hypothetical protein